MESMRAASFFNDDEILVKPLVVKGQGASAIAVEFRADCIEASKLSSRFVGKCYKAKRATPESAILHEFRMLQAAQECPHVVKAFGLFLMPTCDTVNSWTDVFESNLLPGAHPDGAQSMHVLMLEKCDHSLQEFDFFRYVEPEAAFVCRSVLTALCYLHGLGIVHRDVKPGNILVKDAGEKIVLGDFGLACWIEASEVLQNQRCGTRGFRAPECLTKKEFCKASDLFAVGSVLYQLLFRTFAFVRESDIETDIATRQGTLPLIPCGTPVGKSNEACHLVRWLLQPCPVDRPSAEGALEHEWFCKVDPQVTLKTFISERHWRNEDDLTEWPVTHQDALRKSEEDPRDFDGVVEGVSHLAEAFSPAGGVLHRTAKSWGNAALGRLGRVRKSMQRLLRRERLVVPEFDIVITPPQA